MTEEEELDALIAAQKREAKSDRNSWNACAPRPPGWALDAAGLGNVLDDEGSTAPPEASNASDDTTPDDLLATLTAALARIPNGLTKDEIAALARLIDDSATTVDLDVFAAKQAAMAPQVTTPPIKRGRKKAENKPVCEIHGAHDRSYCPAGYEFNSDGTGKLFYILPMADGETMRTADACRRELLLGLASSYVTADGTKSLYYAVESLLTDAVALRQTEAEARKTIAAREAFLGKISDDKRENWECAIESVLAEYARLEKENDLRRDACMPTSAGEKSQASIRRLLGQFFDRGTVERLISQVGITGKGRAKGRPAAVLVRELATERKGQNLMKTGS